MREEYYSKPSEYDILYFSMYGSKEMGRYLRYVRNDKA